MSYRVGFASIDGTFIDQQFGSAKYWQIYDIGDTAQFVETRKTVPGCRGNCDSGFEHILHVLKDCDAIFVSKIGEYAARTVISRGKRVFEASGEIEEIISRLLEENFLKNQL
ncbi:diguanylate cyclase [Thermoclostridium stercorarium subsp. leptospartum DSM 9219]|uniref:Diguanylate cyclase n=1 Tax=Thermoclostridium stercorarium subsp. leptospartum DSM 9219 TaxID=1346611 RepID=A0A1B1YMD8_THEST|nr:NifB/NifX family molybdenum-iron cluster-binding protein [Thermoclostridium stercorarium]ANX01886.1 diguanylate cyclase [Thermoclostridium stercorarium subsp. leptospartum DSM 9219]